MTIENFAKTPVAVGWFETEMRDFWTADITVADGTRYGVSRKVATDTADGEDLWTVDSMFAANGFPIFSNGVGSRCVRTRHLVPGSPLAIQMDNALAAHQKAENAA